MGSTYTANPGQREGKAPADRENPSFKDEISFRQV